MSDNPTIVNPDYDRANQGTLAGVVRQYLQQYSLDTDNMMPATVVSYDRVSNVAVIQPAIMMVAQDGTSIARAPIATVSVVALGGNGFVINFPLVAGSKGWVEACDRDISLYLQSGQNSPPNTRRMHSFSSSRFIPDIGSDYTIASEDADNLVIQKKDGTYRIAIASDKIKVTTPGGTATFTDTKISFVTPRFDLDSADINFSSNPNIGPIPP